MKQQDLSSYLESSKRTASSCRKWPTVGPRAMAVVTKDGFSSHGFSRTEPVGMWMSSYAADNIVVDSGTATGATNTVTDDKTARVVGTKLRDRQ